MHLKEQFTSSSCKVKYLLGMVHNRLIVHSGMRNLYHITYNHKIIRNFYLLLFHRPAPLPPLHSQSPQRKRMMTHSYDETDHNRNQSDVFKGLKKFSSSEQSLFFYLPEPRCAMELHTCEDGNSDFLLTNFPWRGTSHHPQELSLTYLMLLIVVDWPSARWSGQLLTSTIAL